MKTKFEKRSRDQNLRMLRATTFVLTSLLVMSPAGANGVPYRGAIEKLSRGHFPSDWDTAGEVLVLTDPQASIFTEIGQSAAETRSSGTACLDPPKEILEDKSLWWTEWDYQIFDVNKSELNDPQALDAAYKKNGRSRHQTLSVNGERSYKTLFGCEVYAPVRNDADRQERHTISEDVLQAEDFRGWVRGLAPPTANLTQADLLVPSKAVMREVIYKFEEHKVFFVGWVIGDRAVVMEPSDAFWAYVKNIRPPQYNSYDELFAAMDTQSDPVSKTRAFVSVAKKIGLVYYEGQIPNLKKGGEYLGDGSPKHK